MNPKNILLMTAALGLIMSAIPVPAQTVRSVPVPILHVPLAITAPGTYVLTGNLTTGQVGSIVQAILIATNIQGPVVLDLKGFTLTGTNITAIAIGSGPAPNTYPITIKNGIVSGGLNNHPLGFPPGGMTTPVTGLTIDKVTFLDSGIWFSRVSSSTVMNCTFHEVGIVDVDPVGGNRYINLTFINNRSGALSVGPRDYPGAPVLTLKDCEFAPPAN